MTAMRVARRGVAVLTFGTLLGVAAPLQPAHALPTLPIENAFTPPGPYATTTTTVTEPSHAPYAVFYPADYGSLGFASPIVTWGNGTDGLPSMYTTLLGHFTSYGSR